MPAKRTRKTQQQQLLDTALKAYPEEYLSCRDMGHTWKPITASRRTDRNIERVLGCDRCETRRIQILDPNGFILANTYTYAKRYTISGAGRIDAEAKAGMRRRNLELMIAE